MEFLIENNVLLGLKNDIVSPESCSLVVPDTVTEIAPRAFYGCSWLDELVIPGSVKKIGEKAFAKTGLILLTLQEGVEEIGSAAFAHCGSLKQVTLPDSVRIIGANAFEGADLDGIRLPASLQEIGDEAFRASFTWDTESLYETVTDWDDETQLIPYIEDIVFPVGLKKIGVMAFLGLNCKKVVLPEGLEELGKWAFHESDMQELVISGSLKSITNGAFEECAQLRSVQINTGVERICEDAFAACKNLRELNIQPGLERIDGYAFRQCEALEELILPEGLLILEDMAFHDCGGLKRVVFPGTLKSIGSDPHIPDIWPEEVTGDDFDRNEGVFSKCWHLCEVVIPEGVEKIGYLAFWDCSLHIKASELPASVKKMHGKCGIYWDEEEWKKGMIWGEN